MENNPDIVNSINFYMQRAHKNRSCKKSATTGLPKVKHLDKIEADIAAGIMQQRFPDQNFTSYPCKYCKQPDGSPWWHVGHKREEVTKK